MLQEVLGKEVVKVGFPPAKKLGWVTMEKSSSSEQMLMCKVSWAVIALGPLLMRMHGERRSKGVAAVLSDLCYDEVLQAVEYISP